jgi:hypothetical protein
MTPSIYGIQMANNGKIYFCKSFDQFLGVIDFPNVMGVGCNYNDFGIDLDPAFMGTTSSLGLPNFVTSFNHQAQFTCPAITTGISEQQGKDPNLSVFPNPSSGEFSIQVNEGDVVSVYSVTGQILEQFNSPVQNKILFGKNYSKGIYLVKVQNHASIRTGRVVKE